MSDTYDRMFLAAADHGDLAMTSDGYRWDGHFGPDAPPIPQYRIEIDRTANEIRAILDEV